jgi:hypothetical protein
MIGQCFLFDELVLIFFDDFKTWQRISLTKDVAEEILLLLLLLLVIKLLIWWMRTLLIEIVAVLCRMLIVWNLRIMLWLKVEVLVILL